MSFDQMFECNSAIIIFCVDAFCGNSVLRLECENSAHSRFVRFADCRPDGFEPSVRSAGTMHRPREPGAFSVFGSIFSETCSKLQGRISDFAGSFKGLKEDLRILFV